MAIQSKVPCCSIQDLSLAYTPGVAEPCREIEKNPDDVYEYTSKGNMVAVVTDGTAVLGLGDIGPLASIPVMEGKAILFKNFAGIDAFPIAIGSKDPTAIVETVARIEAVFGGINLEDISAPRCFEVEARLKKILNIPVFHDDQHGTAVVALAALINALKVVGKELRQRTRRRERRRSCRHRRHQVSLELRRQGRCALRQQRSDPFGKKRPQCCQAGDRQDHQPPRLAGLPGRCPSGSGRLPGPVRQAAS